MWKKGELVHLISEKIRNETYVGTGNLLQKSERHIGDFHRAIQRFRLAFQVSYICIVLVTSKLSNFQFIYCLRTKMKSKIKNRWINSSDESLTPYDVENRFSKCKAKVTATRIMRESVLAIVVAARRQPVVGAYQYISEKGLVSILNCFDEIASNFSDDESDCNYRNNFIRISVWWW